MKITPITYNLLGKNGTLGSQLFQIASTIGIGSSINRTVSFPEDWEYLTAPNGGQIFAIPSFYFSGLEGEDLGNNKLQEVDHFLFIGNHIRKLLSPTAFIKKDVSSNLYFEDPAKRRKPYVAIHVRKNISESTSKPELSLKYYYKAMSQFDPKKVEYFLFSNDIEWCKEYFDIGLSPEVAKNIHYVDEFDKDYEDLAAMAMCDYFIISNSNFAWWGAYLSFNPNKKVYYPSVWTNEPAHVIDPRLLFPNYYCKLEC